ncbi:MAG: hypothetical protein IPO27_02815 [Bacteroidetes bacterium]|nr:hypothetical protein [Bacteroidota bacterium]
MFDAFIKKRGIECRIRAGREAPRLPVFATYIVLVISYPTTEKEACHPNKYNSSNFKLLPSNYFLLYITFFYFWLEPKVTKVQGFINFLTSALFRFLPTTRAIRTTHLLPLAHSRIAWRKPAS